MGKTKTRLEKALTREACVKAHSAFLKDIFDSAMSQEWDTFVFYNKDGALDILKNILPLQKEFYPQKGESLGEKMYSAISQVLKKGYDACVLVGSDIPEIKRGDFQFAFQKLQFYDGVLGGTLDGGYYLVGMKKAYSAIFDNQIYSVSTVLESTVHAMEKAKLTYAFVETKSDIDEPKDLEMLCEKLKFQNSGCPHTKEFLNSIGWIKDI